MTPLTIVVGMVIAIFVIFGVAATYNIIKLARKTGGACLFYIVRKNLKYMDLECVVCGRTWRITRDRIVDE